MHTTHILFNTSMGNHTHTHTHKIHILVDTSMRNYTHTRTHTCMHTTHIFVDTSRRSYTHTHTHTLRIFWSTHLWEVTHAHLRIHRHNYAHTYCLIIDSAISFESSIFAEQRFHLNPYLWANLFIISLSNSGLPLRLPLSCHISRSASLTI